jgi:type II secretory pathway component PulC
MSSCVRLLMKRHRSMPVFLQWAGSFVAPFSLCYNIARRLITQVDPERLMVPVAIERKKKKKATSVSAEMAENIVAAALSHPSIGADRLARQLGDEGISVSSGLVYRTLRGKGLQTRELRVRFLKEQTRLEKPAGSRKPSKPPELTSEPLREQLQVSPGPPVPEPALGYPATPAPTLEEKKPEVPSGILPAHMAAPVGAPRINKIEKANSGKEKWLFRGINLLLAAFMVFLLIRIGVGLYDDERQEPAAAATPPSASNPPVEDGEPVEANRPMSEYRVILNRNLFGSASNPGSDGAREAAEIKAIALAGNEVGLKLIGTAVTRDRRQNYAVLEVTKTSSQEICREKDVVANVLIKRILRNNVIILTASGEQRLAVDEKLTAGTSASLVQPAAAGVNFPGAPQADGENPELTYEIPRSEIARALPGIRERLDELNISAEIPVSKPDGFTLGRVVASDVLFRIGIRTGDVIKSVDGEAVDGPEDAERFLQRMIRGGDFSILVERRGQLQPLNLSIK